MVSTVEGMVSRYPGRYSSFVSIDCMTSSSLSDPSLVLVFKILMLNNLLVICLKLLMDAFGDLLMRSARVFTESRTTRRHHHLSLVVVAALVPGTTFQV